MEKQFTTYEIALKLKELNFNEECFGHYVSHLNSNNIDLNIIKSNYNSGKYVTIPEDFYTDAPLWQQVIDWCREKYNLFILISPKFGAIFGDCTTGITCGNIPPMDSFEEIRESAILKAIEIIEKEII